MRYKGPCIDCGESKNQQYILKRCIACYQKFQRYNPEFHKRIKYPGPCIDCGSTESSNGRFVCHRCALCYSRFKLGSKPKQKYLGPCIKCGNIAPGKSKYFIKKMCSKCLRKYYYAKQHPTQEKNCIDCGKTLKQGYKKIIKRDRCNNCYRKWKRRTDPSYAKKETDRLNKYKSTDKGIEASRSHVRSRRARLAQVENTLTTQEWKEILNQHNYKCVYCGSTEKIEMDHIIPISKGGSHTKQNVVPACRSCNNKKGNKIIS